MTNLNAFDYIDKLNRNVWDCGWRQRCIIRKNKCDKCDYYTQTFTCYIIKINSKMQTNTQIWPHFILNGLNYW